jgi:hypothetical protein
MMKEKVYISPRLIQLSDTVATAFAFHVEYIEKLFQTLIM